MASFSQIAWPHYGCDPSLASVDGRDQLGLETILAVPVLVRARLEWEVQQLESSKGVGFDFPMVAWSIANEDNKVDRTEL
jgi:hypothetical protein